MKVNTISNIDNSATPLPKAQLWCASFVQITEGMNTNILFPFLAFMTEDFGYTGFQFDYCFPKFIVLHRS